MNGHVVTLASFIHVMNLSIQAVDMLEYLSCLVNLGACAYAGFPVMNFSLSMIACEQKS